MKLLEIHIEATDMKLSVEFYKSVLDYEKVMEFNDGKQAMFVMKDGCCFGIWEKEYLGLFDGRAAEHIHYAFQITPGDYQHIKEKLESLQVDISEHEWPDGQKSIYFFDPDGHQGEFMTKDWLGNTSL
ncbi:MAG: hypothetical protein GF307_00445 [candidate division Zixibacteria bacterium]|nr:hypothetical protein [candidate division Zixibacteria bacterium]